MTIKYFTKKPIPVPGVQYFGADNRPNITDLMEFTDGQFRLIGSPDNLSAQVYDYLHTSWINVKPGDWILRGVQGEFYPHDGELFPHAYDEVVA